MADKPYRPLSRGFGGCGQSCYLGACRKVRAHPSSLHAIRIGCQVRAKEPQSQSGVDGADLTAPLMSLPIDPS